MKIKFDHIASGFYTFKPGDELSVTEMTPEMQKLLTAVRLDGKKVAHLVTSDEDDETATIEAEGETAVTGRTRRGHRPAPISG